MLDGIKKKFKKLTGQYSDDTLKALGQTTSGNGLEDGEEPTGGSLKSLLFDDEEGLKVSDSNNVMDKVMEFLSGPDNRQEKYKQLGQAVQDSVMDSVLTQYADDVFGSSSGFGGDIWVEAENEDIQEEANRMLEDTGFIENARALAFDSIKWGDFFVPIKGEEGQGIVHADFKVKPGAFKKFEAEGETVGYTVQTEKEKHSENHEFRYPWEVIHFRHGVDSANKNEVYSEGVEEATYGASIFDASLPDFKKLIMSENTLVLNRYQKSRRPLMMYINMEDVAEDEKDDYYNAMKRRILNSQSFSQDEEITSERELHSMSEPIAMPMKGSRPVEFEDLSESVNIDSIVDVEYLRKKVFGSLAIPSIFIGLEDKLPNVDVGQSSILPNSQRYARTVRRIQSELLLSFKRAVRVHFAYKNQFIKPGDIEVHTRTVTTAEQISRAEAAEKIASNFESIANLFGRGPLEDVDLDTRAFAEFVIGQLNIPDFTAEKVLEKNELEDEDPEIVNEIAKHMKVFAGRNYQLKSDLNDPLRIRKEDGDITEQSEKFDEFRERVLETAG